ncbi:MAG: aldo/keto reductase [Micropruina sp.]
MRRVQLGSLTTSALCLGGNVFGWTADRRTSFDVLDRFTAAGGDFVDTADVYSAWVRGHVGGESETVLGEWLRTVDDRASVVIASKVAKHPAHPGLTADNVRTAFDLSRRRLGVDRIDLYYAHEDDTTVPAQEWMAVFNELRAAGQIGEYGLSNFSTARTAEVLAIAAQEGWVPPVAIQPPYSLVDRRAEGTGLTRLAAQSGLGVICYHGLAAGFLTGKYRRDTTPTGPRASSIKHYATEDAWAVEALVVEIAQERECPPGALALAWLLHQEGTVVPIASASTPSQVPALMAALDVTLTPEQLTKLDLVSRPFL